MKTRKRGQVTPRGSGRPVSPGNKARFRTMNIFDRYSMRYDAWYDTHKFAYLSELELLKGLVPASGRGLEIGVGTGRFAGPLGIAEGVDPSARMLAVAGLRGVNVRPGFGEDLPFPESAFDFAAVITALCFVDDPLKVLREAGRVLKDRGPLVLAVIDRESFLGRAYRKKRRGFYKDARFFGVEEALGLLGRAGFEPVACRQTLFSFPDSLDRVEPCRDGFGEGGFVGIKAAVRKNSG